MKKATRDTVLGLVFFGGLGLLLWATQALSGITFGDRTTITVRFENARGLRQGEPVYVLGTQQGKVVRVTVRPREDNTYYVEAEIQLDSTVTLTTETQIRVVDASMLGGKKVEIIPGPLGATKPEEYELPTGYQFVGTAPLGPLGQLGKLVSGEGNKANLEGALKGIKDFMAKLNDSQGSLARFIEDRTLIDDAEAFIASLRNSAEELEKKQSLLGRLIYDETLGTKTGKILDDLDKVTTQLTGTDSTLGRLINDSALGTKVDTIVDDVSQVTAKLKTTDSVFGRLINDESLGQKFENIVSEFETTAKSLNNKDSGLFGALLNDGELLADGRKIIRDVSEITEKINKGDGALGRLINDPDMGRRLDSMIRQVTRAIEDAREAAPIGTFFQVFSGAF